MTVLLLVAGLAVLTVGAELLVRGASALAISLKISPLVVGLTVVAFGTGSPELTVSLQSSLQGKADIALGNVVGSNICNVLLILGVSAAITPLVVSQQLIRIDVPLMIAASVLIGIFGFDGRIDRIEGTILVAGLIAYTTWAVLKSRSEQKDVVDEYAKEFGASGSLLRNLAVQIVLVAVGLVLLVWGAKMFLDAAVEIARGLGMSELVIGLTLVAIGTSLPEIAASVMAAVRGERDIAVGNVVGSNLFNIMGVLGIASIFSPAGISVPQAALHFDIPVMTAAAVACLPVFFTGHRIDRWEGVMFLAYFIAYTTYLALSATHQRTLGVIMLGFVIPLTVITLAIGVYRAVSNPNDAEENRTA